MSSLAINPYINFQGKAREAFEHYKSALGGEVVLLSFDSNGPPRPAGPADSIMHGVLTIEEGVEIMGTDGMAEHPAKQGENFAVALSGTDQEKLTKAFDVLSEGGNVKAPLKVESWGATFGWLEDKFGINWMININKA